MSVSKHHKCYYKNSSWQHQNSLKEMAKNGESLERKNYKWAITSSMGTLPQSHSPSKKLCKVSSAKRGVKKQWPCRKSIFLNGQMLFPFSLHRFASMVQCFISKSSLHCIIHGIHRTCITLSSSICEIETNDCILLSENHQLG